MKTVIQNRFDGGNAEDIRTTQFNKCEFSKNFDVFTEPYRLTPYADSIADTADVTMDDTRISDVGICTISGTDYIVGVGFESGASTKVAFYTKTAPNGTFSQQAVSASGAYVSGSLVTYKTSAYAVSDNASGTYTLWKFVSAGTVTSIGTISTTSGLKVSTFVHPEDNILYVTVGNVIAKWDNSSYSTATSILPANFYTTSITNYGTYLAIAMNPSVSSNKAVCYLWGRDTTINTLQATLDLGEGYVGIVENLDNNLFFVMSPNMQLSTNLVNKIIVKGYSGGAVDTIVSIMDSSSLSIGQVYSYKAKRNNKVYFGFANSDSVYNFGKNKEGSYIVSNDRFIINGTQISSFPSSGTITGISIIGDLLWVGTISTTGTFTLQRSKINSLGESLTYTATSQYKSTINPNMPIADRYSDKKLRAVQVAYTGASSGTTVLKYSVDGSAMTTIISQSNTTGEHVIEATNQNDGSPFLSGREFQFQIESTGGSKIKEVKYAYDNLTTTI